MLRTLLSSVAPRATAAGRSLLPAAGRSPLTALASSHEAHQGGRSLALDCVAPAATASRSVAARKCSRRDMCSASAKVATSGSADTSTAPGEGSGDGQNGAETEMGSGQDARDPSTGEGIWMDQEDEPLELEKPKKIQKFCGKVVTDNMDKTIKVAVPYWYYVKKLGRRIVRYSKIMAHDENNTANIGDTVILVDCKQKSKRKKHKLLTIVRKLPRLDDV